MYDRHLDSFIKVVELGSFSKAGEALFVSPNAVIRQIDCLERDLGLRLLDRGYRGVRPTAAGRRVYEGAKQIIAQSHEVVREARALASPSGGTVRLASSVMAPTRRIGRWWAEVSAEHPGIKLEIVPFHDDYRIFSQMVDSLGKKADAMVVVEPLRTRSQFKAYEVRPLFMSPGCVAVPTAHPLASRRSLRLDDLEHERVYIVERGHALTVEAIRDAIETARLDVDIVDCPPYNAQSFNDAASEGALVMHCFELGEVHPSFTNIELEGFSYPFCLTYPKKCSPVVREFADAVCARTLEGGEGIAT